MVGNTAPPSLEELPVYGEGHMHAEGPLATHTYPLSLIPDTAEGTGLLYSLKSDPTRAVGFQNNPDKSRGSGHDLRRALDIWA